MLGSSLLLGAATLAAQSASALRIPARSQPVSRRNLSFSSDKGLKSRPVTNAATTSTTSSGSTLSLTNHIDNVYLANITLGGAEFTVQLDTGSTDLVLVPDKHIQTTLAVTDYVPNATYGTGWMSGPVAFAKLEFGNYTIDSQAFLNGTSESFFDKSFFPIGIRGILGVALDISSNIHRTLNEVYGAKQGRALSRNALDNLFLQKPELKNFTTVYLGRSDDGESTDEGIFTIGEYLDDTEDYFTNISSLDVVNTAIWGVPIDGVTINRQKLALNSSVKGAPAGKSIAVLDTGTSKADVPPYVFNAMYSAFEGAWYSEDMGSWIVPCLSGAPNITYTFGGQDFYIHPLDLSDINDLRPDFNYTVCTASFGILDILTTEMDMLLGDSFLRNSYTVFDYGSFTDDDVAVETPSVKMLPLSSSDEDYSDFLTYRARTLASLPPEATKEQILQMIQQASSSSNGTAGASDAATDDASLLSSAATSASSDSSYQALVNKLDTFGPVVIGLLGAIFVALLGLLAVGISMCIRRGRSVGVARNAAPSYAPVPLHFKEPEYKDEENARYNE